MTNREESEKRKLSPPQNITSEGQTADLIPIRHQNVAETTAAFIDPAVATIQTRRVLFGVDAESKTLLAKFLSGAWTMDGFLGASAIVALWLGDLLSITTVGLLLLFLMVFHYVLKPLLEKLKNKLEGNIR